MSASLIINQPDVRSAEQVYMNRQRFETDNQSTTITTKTLAVGATLVEFCYLQGSGAAATGRFLYIVLNAISDADAAFRLATPGCRSLVALGDTQEFRTVTPVTRIDYVTDIAETGTSKILLKIGR
jgi:hypothetical protein